MTRTVLVTGASKGIGRAIACGLAADGFSVVVHYHRDAEGARQTLTRIEEQGGAGRLMQFDSGDRARCRTALEADIEAHGAYWGVVNNAGVARDGAFPALSEDDWDGVIHTNLDSFYNVIQPCVMPMIGLRDGGRIITLSSVSGLLGNRGQVNYSAAKAGIIGATKALAVELAKRRITVNCIAPGLIDTGMIEMEEARAERSDAYHTPAAHGAAGRGRRPCALSDVSCRRLRNPPGYLYQRRYAVIHRVVVTGMGGVTAFGESWQEVATGLRSGKNAVRAMPEWQVYDGLNTLLGAPADNFTLPDNYTRKRIRAMGRVSLLATRATELALAQAGLLDDAVLTSGDTGIAYGSSTGSTGPVSEFATMLTEKHTRNITGTTYVQMMPHTTAVNAGLFFGLRGRVIPTSSACTSGSQAIGYAWEAIRHGYQTVMVAGGAEELCPSEAAVFDTLFATSQRNDRPHTTPSPFDRQRDGLVIGEGAGTLILEDLEHAKARGAKIYAEIVGFHTNCDAAHITQPQKETMQICIERGLRSAGLAAGDIGYLCAHGTATDRGDIAETQATAAVFGAGTPISSLKSYLGHTLGACGALEAWMSIEMMREGWFAETLNLHHPDEACGELDYIMGSARRLETEFVQSNNFAFGGINTSLVLRRWP